MNSEPIMLTTWKFGPVANGVGYPMLVAGGDALDAAVEGATAVESDESIASVGVGGLPDAGGQVSLDACVMTDPGRCGSVAYVRGRAQTARLARCVMERTPHVMIVGDGAEQLAAKEGIEQFPLLTGAARAEWLAWKRNPATFSREPYKGWIVPGDEMKTHDTVSILTRDVRGSLAGVCSTSGMAFKHPGRVGDSPIIGHGLYVDQTVGGAAATGTGELIMGLCGSFLVVELMRQGVRPVEACMELLRRAAARYRILPDHQIAVIAMTNKGDWASAALKSGFHHTISDARGTRVEEAMAVLS